MRTSHRLNSLCDCFWLLQPNSDELSAAVERRLLLDVQLWQRRFGFGGSLRRDGVLGLLLFRLFVGIVGDRDSPGVSVFLAECDRLETHAFAVNDPSVLPFVPRGLSLHLADGDGVRQLPPLDVGTVAVHARIVDDFEREPFGRRPFRFQVDPGQAKVFGGFVDGILHLAHFGAFGSFTHCYSFPAKQTQ